MPLDTRSQCLLDHGNGMLRRHRTLKELAYGRALHHLCSAVACHVTETVRAVDYVAAGLLSIGHQKTTIWKKQNERSLRQYQIEHRLGNSQRFPAFEPSPL